MGTFKEDRLFDDVTKEDLEKAQSFGIVPEGFYNVACTGAETKEDFSSTGKRKYVELRFQILQPELYQGLKLRKRVYCFGEDLKKNRMMRAAFVLNYAVAAGHTYEVAKLLDSSDFIGLRSACKVIVKPYTDHKGQPKKSNEISGYKALIENNNLTKNAAPPPPRSENQAVTAPPPFNNNEEIPF